MKVLRSAWMDASSFEIGDVIKVDLNGESHTATAIQDEGDSMLFLLDDFMDEAYPMNREGGTKGGYEQSDMRKHLQEIGATLPEKTAKWIVPFENGDIMRLLTLPEMCGVDDNFDECEGQIEWLKQDRRHRIASRKGDEYEWGWLATVVSGAHFAIVANRGFADYCQRFALTGCAPCFQNPPSSIRILRTPLLREIMKKCEKARFSDYSEPVREFDELLAALPQEAWIS